MLFRYVVLAALRSMMAALDLTAASFVAAVTSARFSVTLPVLFENRLLLRLVTKMGVAPAARTSLTNVIRLAVRSVMDMFLSTWRRLARESALVYYAGRTFWSLCPIWMVT